MQIRTSPYWSTRQVAELLGVTETTVKRWADAQKLPCVRTPGGHRKFLPHEVLAFARAQGYRLEAILPSEIAPSASWERYREWLYRWLIDGDSRMVGEQLYAWIQAGHELATLYDEVITPVLERIGSEWEHGVLSVAEEHVASKTLLEVLHSLRQRTFAPRMERGRAICAALEEEQHMLGLVMAAHVLESEGFLVDFLGARTPLSDLLVWLQRHPDSRLLCLSFSMPVPEDRLRALLSPIRDAAHRYGARLYAGGRAADPRWVEQDLVDRVFHSLREFRRILVGEAV